MAEVIYKTVKKPIEERLIDAACVYWDIQKSDLFGQLVERKMIHRRQILLYLIKKETILTLSELSLLFGLKGKSNVNKVVSDIECTKDIYSTISEPINAIRHLASTLDADFIIHDVKLVNKKIVVNG